MKKFIFTLLAFLIIGTGLNFSSAMVIVPPATVSNEPDPATVRSAVLALKHLPRKERKNRFKLAMKELKAFKAAKKAGKEPDTNTILLVILAILLPPLAVYLHEGVINNKFWITLLLFILGIAGVFLFSWLALLAAIIYALIVVLS
jgi:uncharacterized membrane protein YqaE (UPF0057 family)